MLLLLRDELDLLDLRGILLGFGVVVWWCGGGSEVVLCALKRSCFESLVLLLLSCCEACLIRKKKQPKQERKRVICIPKSTSNLVSQKAYIERESHTSLSKTYRSSRFQLFPLYLLPKRRAAEPCLWRSCMSICFLCQVVCLLRHGSDIRQHWE